MTELEFFDHCRTWIEGVCERRGKPLNDEYQHSFVLLCLTEDSEHVGCIASLIDPEIDEQHISEMTHFVRLPMRSQINLRIQSELRETVEKAQKEIVMLHSIANRLHIDLMDALTTFENTQNMQEFVEQMREIAQGVKVQ